MLQSAFAIGMLLFGADDISAPCQRVPPSQLHRIVANIMSKPPGAERIELTSDLAQRWEEGCVDRHEEKRNITRDIAELLKGRELRSYAARMLFDMGSNVVWVKREIHDAYLDQKLDIERKRRLSSFISGPDITDERALKCLDIRARFGITNRRYCKAIEDF